jgi:hypothetical protein
MIHRLILPLLCLTSFAVAQGLVWEKTEVEFTPKPGDTEAKVEYRFVNQGKTPVTIRRIRSTCGCTTATLQQGDTYQPGEKGAIAVVFRFEGRTGMQVNTVFVTTDEPDEPTTTLRLTGTLPWNVQVNQRLLVWPTNGALDPQEVLVETKAGEEMTLVKVDLDNKNFTCKVEPTDTPNQYRLTFVPTATAARAQTIATLRTKPELNEAELARSRIFLYVR